MKNSILAILVLTSIAAFGQSSECSKFKNGKFKIIDAEVGNSIIERKGTKQVEYGEGSKLKLEFKVKWLSECVYTLELKKIIENPNNIKLPEGMILTIEIIETRENSYVQKTSSNLYDMVLQSELIKIE